MDRSGDGDWPTKADEHREFVCSLYSAILGREGDQAGVTHFCAQLAEGVLTKPDVAFAMVTSPEYTERHAGLMPMIFAGVFRGLVGKQPDPRDMAKFSSTEPTTEGVAKFVREILEHGSSNDSWFRSFVTQHGFVKILLEEIASDYKTESNQEELSE